MKTTYQWLGESGERKLVVTNLETKKSITIPKQAALDRVTGSTLYGAQDNDELLIAKTVADKSGRIDEIEKWLENRDRGTLIRDLNAKLGEKDAKLAELEAKLRAAGIE